MRVEFHHELLARTDALSGSSRTATPPFGHLDWEGGEGRGRMNIRSLARRSGAVPRGFTARQGEDVQQTPPLADRPRGDLDRKKVGTDRDA